VRRVVARVVVVVVVVALARLARNHPADRVPAVLTTPIVPIVPIASGTACSACSGAVLDAPDACPAGPARNEEGQVEAARAVLLNEAKACRAMPRVDVLLPAPGTAHRDHAHPVPLVGRWRVGHVLERYIRTIAVNATATVANAGAAAETETDP